MNAVYRLAVHHSQIPNAESPAAVTGIVRPAVSVTGALMQHQQPGLSKPSQTSLRGWMCTLEKVEGRQLLA